MRTRDNIVRDTKVAKRRQFCGILRRSLGLILLCRPSKRRLGRFLSAGNSIYFRVTRRESFFRLFRAGFTVTAANRSRIGQIKAPYRARQRLFSPYAKFRAYEPIVVSFFFSFPFVLHLCYKLHQKVHTCVTIHVSLSLSFSLLEESRWDAPITLVQNTSLRPRCFRYRS